jgi:catechol 2,3-dioxygenase-like lactoylglutathione lyase family enzyme
MNATEEFAMPEKFSARLEHLNVTTADPPALANLFCRLFDWHIRWQGSAIHGGHTLHVGSKDDYIAIYGGRTNVQLSPPSESYSVRGALNHIGVVVSDLDAVEARVKAEGFKPHSHANYEPGRRFYFDGPDEIEIEVVCYD